MQGSKNFYIYNAQGNVSKLLNTAGETVADYTFDAFGVQKSISGEVYNPFRHNGEYYDDELGYTYLRNRYYDNNIGRFITEDPVKDGLNWYSYCYSNPVNFKDSSGLSGVLGWLDWNKDGFEDTEMDRKRFDVNNNNIADWIEAGYSTEWEWNATKTSNTLIDFPFSRQDSRELCWANDISMITKWFTDRNFNEREVAIHTFGNSGFNKGATIRQIIDTLENGPFLMNSSYKVNHRYTNRKNDENNTEANLASFIKTEIDNGRPMILSTRQHVVVIVGYDFSDPAHRKIICHDSDSGPYEYGDDELSILVTNQDTAGKKNY